MTMNVADYARECAAQGLRGDYSVCRADFTVEQSYNYTADEQAVWRTLCDRQTKLTKKLAHRSYLDGVATLGLLDRIPDFGVVSEKLRKLTGWEIVAVPGLIPAPAFFVHLAARRFPVTNWLRTKQELDYIVEPDMFHDFFGHVPVLTQPVFADFMKMYGEKAEHLIALGGDEMISRLYWYTVEYGLIREAGQPLKAFGAGLMSSFAELQFAVESKDAHHVHFDLETVMRTSYEIDKFQRAYFVLPSFDVLRDAFQNVADMAAIIGRHKGKPALDPAKL
ncbi:phenylalanine 4-monooxygenase [Mesorhizobium sp.]|uniref:phenylalanine 4-monooxygenase n=1 Tax=Mesorhizobium sp. TaxID=1871066 RepID=UPI000FE3A9EA|nr:phenylalanine 4-monooxygenase [Mesorhizobium sp.]RWN64287.1 MAG: phenylalanine 4-monooxygenase [Mesorhizobium sp.]RWO32255.1 MAG: phenylalanine 4-monooxygenase [Mesorhizobium sp.]RWO37944.1 MAG: phenylalanine 4-monooxygenase [Mesorhizobium sp.]RWO52968.1 MAG: phenylalanine 4-monooxygenase [Mesorhizobium sp.]TIN29047.1 MAG: phenylalanine 4-monooxygenase [Mesorhizobium sp.]